MATLILNAAGQAAGGPVGAFLGSELGQRLDNAVFGPAKLPGREGPRLADLAVQTSTYGRMIPILYGTVRVAGNIIWSRPIKETAVTSTATAGGKGGGGKVSQSQTTYSYSVTLAIAIGEGPIDEVVRVWADAALINLNGAPESYALYKGTEDQMPDPVIEAYEGVGSTPAYRGVAYVVIEDFPLADYGNRIPNFTFELKKRILPSDFDGDSVENLIKSIVMIPGSGEFVYDTEVQTKVPGEQAGSEWAQAGGRTRINQNNHVGMADALLALDQMQSTLPNVEWVSVVVGWLGNSLDAGDCMLKPGVEYQTGATTEPDVWAVGSFTRATAHVITLEGGRPVYGGTPDDDSLLRYLDELKDRGFNILFYPMFFMDVEDKPWRGRVTGTSIEVSDFFTKTNGYNTFIIHYANLVADRVDAFSIGSELIGLTKVKDGSDNFPAVDELVALAATVKGIVGGGVKVTYAADWSEYHHTDGGWYNLDPLWASDDIDFIGIDAYFPLGDAPQSDYDVQAAMDGWTEGEGYDWYYTDPERTTQADLDPPYAWKNIQWWWENEHVNPDMSTTAWMPESKPIWFTEYGFPSVDGATNQPNVFYDPDSSESGFPYHSRGRVDFLAQRVGIMATEKKWGGSGMIERRFLWTWDARPFPFWPDLTNVWSDGPQWQYGHWVNGKLGLSGLSGIVADICERAGLESGDIDVSRLIGLVDGYVLTSQVTARQAIEDLRTAYFFDGVESDGKLKFLMHGGDTAAAIEEDKLVRGESLETLAITRIQELELPQKVDILYLSKTSNYQTGDQHSQRLVTESREQETVRLPIVFADQQAKIIADVTLFRRWLARARFRFRLPPEYLWLEPGDVIAVNTENASHTIRLLRTRVSEGGMLEMEAAAEDISAYDFYHAAGSGPALVNDIAPAGETRLEILDLPLLPADADRGAVRLAVAGLENGWRGAAIYRSDDGGGSYGPLVSMETSAAMGNAITALASGPAAVFDEANAITVLLIFGELESVNELAALNGANAAVLGDEIIQFRTATLVSANKYTLSGLLRGRLGTEDKVSGHAAGERFVLLNGSLARLEMANNLIGLLRSYKPVSFGDTVAGTDAQDFTYAARALKPYSPVHVTGSRDGSGNLTIVWIRRTRTGGEWRDGADVPLAEESERYEVDIMNGGNVARTLASTMPAASYSAAQQTTDFGSPQSSITVRVYQLSAVVGRGVAKEVVV